MQRLMVLGGSRYALPVIKAAHDLGIYVITADYLPNNIAHKFSDEYCNISIVDEEATLKAAQERKIDGITSFACDPGVVTAAYVAEKMGLPSCGSYESVCILQNKGKFRRFLADHGFTVPVAKAYITFEEAVEDACFKNIFNWPVIVKPTDSAGSKGVSCVDNPKGLKAAIDFAISFSLSNEFIIEDFIAPKGFPSDTDSFSIDGELKFVSFNSQRFDAKADNPYTPAAYSWPSSMTEEHQKELASELQRLITLLGLRTSIYNIETRESNNGKAYIMECSPRGGGNRLAECLEYATGVKLIENAVRAAMGMPIIGITQKPYDGCWAEVVLHSKRDGIFKELWIDETIKNCVVEKDLWIEPGAAIKGFTAANWAVGMLILRFENEEKLRQVMVKPSNYVKVILQD